MVTVRALALTQAAVGTAVYRGRNFSGGRVAMRTISMVGPRFQEPTYGDVFNTRGNLRDKRITPDDTERMRNAESATVGQTVKGGTAARMQSAVSRASAQQDTSMLPSLDEVVAADVANSVFTDVNVGVVNTAADIADSVFEDVNVGAGPGTKKPDPTGHPVTIGEALEVAAENIGDKPVDRKDARVIQSAESRATGNALGVKRVVAAEAQSAADKNASGSTTAIPIVRDVLGNASEKMPVDKVVTHQDAAKVQSVEQRNSPTGRIEPGGIAATLQSFADKNAAAGAEPEVDDGGRMRTSSQQDASMLPSLDEVVAADVANSVLPDFNVGAAADLADSVFEDVNVGVGPGTKKPDPTGHPITIGEALEVAAENIGDKPVDRKDARVIQSAESRATGNAPGVKRVVAAEAQSAADKNASGSTTSIPIVRDVLGNASEKMPVDKVVTHQDAAKVQSVEQRYSPTGRIEPGGIAATLQSAADKNAAAGVEPEIGDAGRMPNK